MAKKKVVEEIVIDKKLAILAFSGGVLSSTYLLQLVNNKYYDKIYAIFFDYENTYELETMSAEEVIKYINSNEKLKNKIIFEKLKISLSEKAIESINLIENSDKLNNKELILTTDALVSLAEKLHYDTNMVVDIHLGMNFDMEDDVLDDYDIAIDYVKDRLIENKIIIKNEYKKYNKQDALRDGIFITEQLGLDFQEFYKRTVTVPPTVKIGNRLYVNIEDPNASTRILAFHQLKMIDPVRYAKDNEILTWDEAVAYFGGTSSKDEFGNIVLVEPEVSVTNTKIKETKTIEEQKQIVEVEEFRPESIHGNKRYSHVTR